MATNVNPKVWTWLERICRFGLAALFVYSAWGKISDPGLFAEMVVRYEILPSFTVGLFSLTLPMVELVAGLMFIVPMWVREAAFITVGLLVMFMMALVLAVVRGLDIDCGCFGVSAGGGRTELLLAIGRDIVLLVPAVWLLVRRSARK